MGYELIYIDERAEWLEKAAAWFHQKWGIPLEAYRESMEERGTKMLYLLTGHIRFYERMGGSTCVMPWARERTSPAGCTEKVRDKRASAL